MRAKIFFFDSIATEKQAVFVVICTYLFLHPKVFWVLVQERAASAQPVCQSKVFSRFTHAV